MPSKRSRDNPVIPDIAENPTERKRIMSMLAQRRYRDRKRKQLESLQAQVENRTRNNQQANNSTTCFPALNESSINTPSGSNIESSSNATIQLPDTNSATPVTYADIDTIPDPLLFQHYLSPRDAFPFVQPDTEDIFSYLSPSALIPEPDRPAPTRSINEDESNFACMNEDEGAPSLSDQLQTYHSSTFSFPDDHLLEVPSLTLLNAAVKVAQRLNIAELLWDISAISPFYKGNSLGLSPPSLLSSSSSSSSGLSPPSPRQEIDVTMLPLHLQPTTSQILIPHHPVIDLLPWPSTRDKLIHIFNLPTDLRPKSAQDPLGLPRLIYDMEDVGGEGIKVHGDDPFALEGWEIGQVMFERWWWAFESEVVERSGHARKGRGEKELTLQTSWN